MPNFSLTIAAKCQTHVQTFTKHLQCLQKDPGKFVGGDTQRPYALCSKVTKFILVKKLLKYLMITASRLAHIQNLTEHLQSLKNATKTAGGVALTRYPVS